MAAATPVPGTSVQVKRMIAALPDRVFQAWTEPEKAKQWLCRVTQQHCTRILEWDLRVGGRYRLEVSQDGNLHLLTGTYREVNPPQKLAFTWSWEENPGLGETLVTVEFLRRGTFTEVVLTHEGFLDAQQCENHKKGWNGCFDRLSEILPPTAEASAPKTESNDFRMVLRLDVPPQKLYEQFATEEGVRNWWTRFCKMDARVGGLASYRFPKADFYAVVRILRLEPNRCVEWECIDSKHAEGTGFSDLRDWIGTKLRFEIAADGPKSELTFTHAGLAPLECAEICSRSWSFYLGQSLRGYLETGTGQPYATEA